MPVVGPAPWAMVTVLLLMDALMTTAVPPSWTGTASSTVCMVAVKLPPTSVASSLKSQISSYLVPLMFRDLRVAVKAV